MWTSLPVQMTTSDLPADVLRARYSNIAGFFTVSSKTGQVSCQLSHPHPLHLWTLRTLHRPRCSRSQGGADVGTALHWCIVSGTALHWCIVGGIALHWCIVGRTGLHWCIVGGRQQLFQVLDLQIQTTIL